ncbi:MAG: response regulator, partial [Acidobacteria bacterium]|nr:response regulator [Acidobacteriota bacterium]
GVTRDHPIVQRAFADITAEPEQQTDPEGEGVLAVPVVSRFGTVVGTLVVSRSAGGEFSDRDRQVASGLAAQAAVAIDNANLYELARRDRNRAEQANVAKDQFLANLSHELRTPMTAIVGWVRMLQLGGLEDAEYEEAIEAISRSARAQAQLIEDILDVSRIATGKMKIEKKPIDLKDVIEAAVDSVWPSLEAKRIDLIQQIPETPMPISGDPHRLQQVIWNLLSNSIKFTYAEDTIELTAERQDGTARITVRDSGEGIDPEALPHIFERFRQADGTSTRTYGGLGLGLSLVDYIVKAHDGVVSAESAGKGKGASFLIELPLETQPGEGAVAGDSLAASELSLAGNRILLAEDDSEIRRMVRTILRHAGARVTGVRDSSQAMDHLANEKFDVLVSDIAMPGEDGLTLIRKIRSGALENRSIPALALTAYASEEDRMRILKAGYDDHLMKPLEPEELLRTIRHLINTAEPRRAD